MCKKCEEEDELEHICGVGAPKRGKIAFIVEPVCPPCWDKDDWEKRKTCRICGKRFKFIRGTYCSDEEKDWWGIFCSKKCADFAILQRL